MDGRRGLLLLVLMILIFLFFSPMGTTISVDEIHRSKIVCKDRGGVSSYNTWGINTVQCNKDGEFVINRYFAKQKQIHPKDDGCE